MNTECEGIMVLYMEIIHPNVLQGLIFRFPGPKNWHLLDLFGGDSHKCTWCCVICKKSQMVGLKTIKWIIKKVPNEPFVKIANRIIYNCLV